MPSKIEGTIVEVRESGNLVTDITEERLRGVPRDERTSVTCDEHVTSGIFPADHKEPPMTFLAFMGSSGTLELAIVDDSASLMLGIRKGEKVTVAWS